MMNGGNPIVFSRGIQMSNINGKINKEEYEAIYDGKVGKAIVKKNDGKMYYIEADQNDIKHLMEQPKSDKSIDKKLKNLVDIPLIEKRKRKRKKRKKKTVRIKTPSRRKHYTVRKKKSPSKKKSKKSKTPSKSKSRRKKTRQKISNDPLTVNNIMKTIT